ncbi:MAG: hypothetical protein J3K34DRAFT_149549 [Monoraphidium minutum]|nr:MAG: hypothetical protein J3K34DRAFT_149549 [Monoraphidium minutum]
MRPLPAGGQLPASFAGVHVAAADADAALRGALPLAPPQSVSLLSLVVGRTPADSFEEVALELRITYAPPSAGGGGDAEGADGADGAAETVGRRLSIPLRFVIQPTLAVTAVRFLQLAVPLRGGRRYTPLAINLRDAGLTRDASLYRGLGPGGGGRQGSTGGGCAGGTGGTGGGGGGGLVRNSSDGALTSPSALGALVRHQAAQQRLERGGSGDAKRRRWPDADAAVEAGAPGDGAGAGGHSRGGAAAAGPSGGGGGDSGGEEALGIAWDCVLKLSWACATAATATSARGCRACRAGHPRTAPSRRWSCLSRETTCACCARCCRARRPAAAAAAATAAAAAAARRAGRTAATRPRWGSRQRRRRRRRRARSCRRSGRHR